MIQGLTRSSDKHFDIQKTHPRLRRGIFCYCVNVPSAFEIADASEQLFEDQCEIIIVNAWRVAAGMGLLCDGKEDQDAGTVNGHGHASRDDAE